MPLHFPGFRNAKARYTLHEPSMRQSAQYYKSSKWQYMWQILIFLMFIVVSFFAGRQFEHKQLDAIPELHVLPYTFKYNRTFTEHTSDATTRAWKSIFPRQGGYFRHPDLAPDRSAFSVFHQLHCLDGIRQGYWMTYDAATTGRKIDESDMPMMGSPSHIRHCIDLLRQSLMCQPDLTIEVKNDEAGGVTGFGTEHRCKDWNELVSWVSRWETYGQH